MIRSKFDLQAREMLKLAKLYCTENRIAVLKILLQASKPLSEEKILAKFGRNSPDKVTIYRTLETFCNAGLVHRAYVHKRAWHFELANHCGSIRCHPHFTCKSCGQTQCLLGLSVPLVKGLKKGFVIHRQQVRLEGLCPACASKVCKAI